MKRQIVGLVGFFLFLVTLVGMTVWMLGKVEDGVKDEYAPTWAAALIIEHLKSHDDEWPSSWEDLQITCTYLNAIGWDHSDYTFDDLRPRVKVDFATDSMTIAASASAPRLIVRSERPDEEFDGDDPNIRIHDYLRLKYDPTQRPLAEIDGDR